VNHTAAALLITAAGLAAGCSSAQPIGELRTHADESFQREEYKRTVAFDTEILRRDPNDFGATVQRGVAYDRLGDSSDAQADFTRAVELQPDASLPRLYRANLALKVKQPDMAIQDIQALQGMELEKHEQIAMLCLAGTTAQEKGDWSTAVRPYRQAIEIARSDPDPATQKHYRDALNNASECYYRLGNFDQASALYGEVIQSKQRQEQPVGEDDWYTMGILNYLRGDFPSARANFAHVSPARQKQAAKVLNDDGFFVAAAK
jgi:Flp pilus assembly protein TadD